MYVHMTCYMYMYIIDLLEGPHHEKDVQIHYQYIESPTVLVHITLNVLECVCMLT